MAVTFASVATLAAVGGGWVVEANNYGRFAALALLALFGVALLFPALSDWLTRPLVALGARMSQSANRHRRVGGPAIAASRCRDRPALGALRRPSTGSDPDGAALQGASIQTSLLLAAYAAGAATSLALALLVGGRVFIAMKRSLGAGQWIRRGLGFGVLVAVAVVGLGLDTGFLTRISVAGTGSLERGLLGRLRPARNEPPHMTMTASGEHAAALPIEDDMPSPSGAVSWLNSPH
jgi:hypothetical protein